MIDFLANPSGVIFRASGRRENPDDTAAATREWAKQLSPNMGTRARLAHAPTLVQGVLDGFPDELVRVFSHCCSQEYSPHEASRWHDSQRHYITGKRAARRSSAAAPDLHRFLAARHLCGALARPDLPAQRHRPSSSIDSWGRSSRLGTTVSDGSRCPTLIPPCADFHGPTGSVLTSTQIQVVVVSDRRCQSRTD